MPEQKLVTPMFIIDAVAITAFWILVLTGAIDWFDTIYFFEPGFTLVLIGMSVVSGMLIGGMYERYYQMNRKDS